MRWSAGTRPGLPAPPPKRRDDDPHRLESADAETRAACWTGTGFDPTKVGVRAESYAGPITQLVRRLQSSVDRPVVDETGLSGLYAWALTFDIRSRTSASASPAAPEVRAVPTIFTALEDQLGLKLTPRTAPYEVFVIDSVEMPTPD